MVEYEPVKDFASASSPGKVYTVSRRLDTGEYTCNCRGWTQRVNPVDGSRSCKHTKSVQGNPPTLHRQTPPAPSVPLRAAAARGASTLLMPGDTPNDAVSKVRPELTLRWPKWVINSRTYTTQPPRATITVESAKATYVLTLTPPHPTAVDGAINVSSYVGPGAATAGMVMHAGDYNDASLIRALNAIDNEETPTPAKQAPKPFRAQRPPLPRVLVLGDTPAKAIAQVTPLVTSRWPSATLTPNTFSTAKPPRATITITTRPKRQKYVLTLTPARTPRDSGAIKSHDDGGSVLYVGDYDDKSLESALDSIEADIAARPQSTGVQKGRGRAVPPGPPDTLPGDPSAEARLPSTTGGAGAARRAREEAEREKARAEQAEAAAEEERTIEEGARAWGKEQADRVNKEIGPLSPEVYEETLDHYAKVFARRARKALASEEGSVSPFGLVAVGLLVLGVVGAVRRMSR